MPDNQTELTPAPRYDEVYHEGMRLIDMPDNQTPETWAIGASSNKYYLQHYCDNYGWHDVAVISGPIASQLVRELRGLIADHAAAQQRDAAVEALRNCQHPENLMEKTGGDTTDVDICGFCGAYRIEDIFPGSPGMSTWFIPKGIEALGKEVSHE